MEYFPITKTATGFHVEGIPDAVKLVSLDDPISRRLSDLALHGADLEFAAECLAAVNEVPKQSQVTREALWRSAIIHYGKCFGKSHARFQLQPKRVYKGEPSEAQESFEFFHSLRNKNVVHDENSYTRGIPCAAVNNGEKSYKIEKVLCLSAQASVLGQENCSNLNMLINKDLPWLVADFDKCCTKITAELEEGSIDELLQIDEATSQTPTVQAVGENRSRPGKASDRLFNDAES